MVFETWLSIWFVFQLKIPFAQKELVDRASYFEKYAYARDLQTSD